MSGQQIDKNEEIRKYNEDIIRSLEVREATLNEKVGHFGHLLTSYFKGRNDRAFAIERLLLICNEINKENENKESPEPIDLKKIVDFLKDDSTIAIPGLELKLIDFKAGDAARCRVGFAEASSGSKSEKSEFAKLLDAATEKYNALHEKINPSATRELRR